MLTKDLEARTFYADAGEGPSEQGGAHAGSWAEHRASGKASVAGAESAQRETVGRLGGASHRNLDLCSAATVGFEIE